MSRTTGYWLPDFSDKRTQKNIALAIGIPGALSFALSRALGGKLAKRDADEFENQIREFVKSENPVLSLDPSIDDDEAEEAASSIGLSKTPDSKRDNLWAKTRQLIGKQAKTKLGGWGNNVPPGSKFTGDFEPGILAALGWLSAIAGWNMAKRSREKTDLDVAELKAKDLANRLEQSEYSRLYQANSPEEFSENLMLKASRFEPSEVSMINAAVTAEHTSEAPVLRALALKHIAEENGGSVTAGSSDDPIAEENGGSVTAGSSDDPRGGLAGRLVGGAIKVGELGYPSLFAALLLGGFSLGKHFGTKTDRNRARKKELKRILADEMLENQTPSILSVGSDLPWEKAKHLPADKAVRPDVQLPEDVHTAQLRQQREIRI